MKDIYENLVTSIEDLREIVGTPNEAVSKKSIAQIDEHIRNYLQNLRCFFFLPPIRKADAMCPLAATPPDRCRFLTAKG